MARMVAPGTDIGRVIQRVITRFFAVSSEPLKVLHGSWAIRRTRRLLGPVVGTSMKGRPIKSGDARLRHAEEH